MTPKNRPRIGRAALLIGAHLFMVSLSISCDGRRFYDLEVGPVLLSVPTGKGVYQDFFVVEVETEDEAEYGVIEGRVRSADCEVKLMVCDDGECEKVFKGFVAAGDCAWFEEFSDENRVFGGFIDKFGECHEGLSGCYREDCREAHDMQFVLESPCAATANVTMGVDLIADEEDDW